MKPFIVFALVVSSVVMAAAPIDRRATPLDYPAPAVPEVSAIRHYPVKVVVCFIVKDTGKVDHAHVVMSTHRDLEDVAAAAVTEWSFSPGIHNGRPVSTRQYVTFLFHKDRVEVTLDAMR